MNKLLKKGISLCSLVYIIDIPTIMLLTNNITKIFSEISKSLVILRVVYTYNVKMLDEF